ncbi:MAG: urease accessory UreF family protein [Planctomycetaceae bacterium]
MFESTGPPLPPLELQPGPASDFILWQLLDSAFPAGAFAHSGGLEAARNWKFVTTAEELSEFVRHSLVQTARSTLPFLAESYRHVERVRSLDAEYDAFLSNHVANRASRAQGRAFLVAAEVAFQARTDLSGSDDTDSLTETARSWWLQELREAMSQRKIAVHLPVIFGIVTRLLSVPLQTALQMSLYVSARDLISAAVRLNIIGALQAQTVQFQLGGFIERAARHGDGLTLRDATQTATVLDLVQATHDRLYTRLFQS